MPLMTGHNIDFIALDCTIKTSGLLLGDEALPQVRGHVLRIIYHLQVGDQLKTRKMLLVR